MDKKVNFGFLNLTNEIKRMFNDDERVNFLIYMVLMSVLQIAICIFGFIWGNYMSFNVLHERPDEAAHFH